MKQALELSFDALTTPELLTMLENCEILRCQLPAVEHPMINQLTTQASPIELGDTLPRRLADQLRITRATARRRIDEAADLGPRRTLTGQPLPPVLPATAAAQRNGHLGAEHLHIIRSFWHTLPDSVDPTDRADAEIELAGYAEEFRPDQLAKLAHKRFDRLVPDGLFSDVERAKRRTLTLGRQDRDGMSPISGYLTPQARATLDAVLARWAAPGMCNPDDATPYTKGTPSQAAINTDHRSTGQRNHDALIALGRAMLASGELGQHNGLPATIIVSTTLTELQNAAGKATTAGDTWLPMTDLIRLASHAHHYLRIFDGVKELALYHSKRIASPGQRIVLHARDRGCSHPGCSVPGYLCEAHHVTDYALKPETDINDLTFACGPHHRLIKPGGWTTRKRTNGTTEWLPPPHLDHGQRRINSYHHPENTLNGNDRKKADDETEDW